MLTAFTFLLTGLLIVLILLITILFILLLIPLHYEIDLGIKQLGLQFNFSLGNCAYRLQASRENNLLTWKLILFGWAISLRSKSRSIRQTDTNQPSADAKRRSSWSIKDLTLDTIPKKQLKGFIRNLWQLIRPERLTVKARIGFSEPHYTGWAMALAGIVQSLNDGYRIDLEGVWDEPCMEGMLQLSGRLIPIRLLWQLLKFILKPEIRAAYRSLRRQPDPSEQPAAA